MNPIELCFGEGKSWLKRHQDVCELNPQRCFEMALDQVYNVKQNGFLHIISIIIVIIILLPSGITQ